MSTNKHIQMWESLRDPELRKQFIDEYINVGIASQIHGLRERQGLTQKKLAKLLGDEKKQPLICAWENPNYGSYTLGTLRDLAKAFDVGLLVRFVPFSTLVNWAVNLTYDSIAPPSFSEEQFHTVAPVRVLTSQVEDTRVGDTTDKDIYDFWKLSGQIAHPSTAKTGKELANALA